MAFHLGSLTSSWSDGERHCAHGLVASFAASAIRQYALGIAFQPRAFASITFKWKDYRVKGGAKGQTRHKTMTLAPEEFMRRFLLHVLPGGFHRIRHYGLLANGARKTNLALARELLHVPPAQGLPVSSDAQAAEVTIAAPPAFVCRHCGYAMIILQTFLRGESIRAPPGPGCTP